MIRWWSVEKWRFVLLFAEVYAEAACTDLCQVPAYDRCAVLIWGSQTPEPSVVMGLSLWGRGLQEASQAAVWWLAQQSRLTEQQYVSSPGKPQDLPFFLGGEVVWGGSGIKDGRKTTPLMVFNQKFFLTAYKKTCLTQI